MVDIIDFFNYTAEDLRDILEDYPWFRLAAEHLLMIDDSPVDSVFANRIALWRKGEGYILPDLTNGIFLLTEQPGNYQSDVDLSVSSVTENAELVTETLAQVYASQGLLEKSIEVYEKLILRFPEKSAYFAAQIDYLKQLK